MGGVILAKRRAAAMARRPVSPAALSQMPGAKMRGVPGSSMGSQGVPAGKTVSRWAERRMQGLVGSCMEGQQFGEGVAGFVEVDVGEAEVTEAIEEPGGAGGFAEGGGGDADEVELPLAELGLMEMQPVEGAVDGGEGGEACDAALGGDGGHQESTSASEYRTSTRKRPRAGAVGPAAARLRAARMWGMESGGMRPVPASAKVPTRLRTMWWRNPVPVTGR